MLAPYCFPRPRSDPPVCHSRIATGENNERLSPSALPFFGDVGVIFESFALTFHLIFSFIFWSETAFFNNKKFKSIRHNFRKSRIVITVSASFNIYETNNRKISVKKTGFCIVLLKSL